MLSRRQMKDIHRGPVSDESEDVKPVTTYWFPTSLNLKELLKAAMCGDTNSSVFIWQRRQG